MTHQPEAVASQTPPIPASGRRLSVDEWGTLEDDARFHELVDGFLVEKPIVAVWHDVLFANLIALLLPAVKRLGLGTLVGGTTPLEISKFHGRKPDVFFIPTDQYHLVGRNVFHGVPPLAVEILSPNSAHVDRVDKMQEYAQLGIGEYWIVDFPNRAVEVYHLHRDGDRAEYHLAHAVCGNDLFRPTMFPGLEIPLDSLWPVEFESPELE
jgi:Uma2 family endonuclease